TVLDNVTMGPREVLKVPRKAAEGEAMELLRRVGVDSQAKKVPAQLSGGQQQRVAIARAMAGKPALFLADEPTGNLDQKTGQQIMDLFRRLNAQGHTIVLITHDEHVAAQAGRAIRIMDGRVEELGGEALPDTEAEGSPADETMPADEALPDAEAWPAEDVDDLFADEPGEEVSE
ncbi:MAG: ABC transporter ATP-binding protein, partial [Lachnospiraceae bacterium]|nr:ABC transporter ATP-binding protein [Lachnospiraceae bacterium]